jgi:hypothetical protein
MADKEKVNNKINKPISEFIEELEKNFAKDEQKGRTHEEESEEEEVEETGESMALLYEKVRNLIEYKDDHLIKRYAIERILRRNLLIELRQQDITEQFLNEFVMAGYIERENVKGSLKAEIKKALSKYQIAVKLVSGYEAKKWLVSLGACEIEEVLFPNPSRYALARAMFQTVRSRIRFSSRIPEKEKDIQIFIAVLKSLSKVDKIFLNYFLAKIYLPQWFEKSKSENEKLAKLNQLVRIAGTLRRETSNPLAVKIGTALRKHAVYFNILYEASLSNISKIKKVFANPESLKFAVQLAADEVYDREMKKYWKRVRRSLAFLVITKVILAVVVEYPFDIYVVGNVNFIPIAINLIFPPCYLLFLSLTIKRPSSANSVLIARGVEEIVYREEQKQISQIKVRDAESASDWALNIFFLLTFAISFGIVIWVLLFLRFNWMGILIFLFLFSVVSFFNALVRQPIRELLIAREKEGLVGAVVDTLSIPFVRIGKWMSTNFARVNVFIFLFDVIIEAPFKVVIRFIQEWAGFIRRKKEEMI